jgi:hypothetical protein
MAFLFLLGSTLFVSAVEGQTDVRIAVLPVVGSTPGQFNSYFKTAIQIYNADTVTHSYRAVYHPAGVPGSPSDPSASLTIPAGVVQYYADFLPAIGISTGLGSLDIFVPPSEVGHQNGIAVARVYNDAGSAGTTGFTEEFYNPNKVYVAGDNALFVLSPNPSAFRNNVGIRTLDDGASMTAILRNSNGAVLKTVTKSYMANFFQQTSLDAFLEGATVVGNESLTIQIASGGGIIYVSTVDDVTQDPSVSVGP